MAQLPFWFVLGSFIVVDLAAIVIILGRIGR